MGKQFKMNMCWGRNSWSRVWWGTILTRPCPKHSQTNICGWALRRTIVRGTTLSNIKGHVPKTNLNKPPSMPLHSPSRSLTLRHATSRSVTRFRQMTQFLKVKSRLFLKNHEKSRWITLRHATSCFRHGPSRVLMACQHPRRYYITSVLPPLVSWEFDESQHGWVSHNRKEQNSNHYMYKTIAHVMFVWYYFIPLKNISQHKYKTLKVDTPGWSVNYKVVRRSQYLFHAPEIVILLMQ